MLRRRTIVIRYVGFAVIAALVNFGFQSVTLALYRGSAALPFSIAAGTLAGLVVKYVLDKVLIFFDKRQSALREIGKLVRYGSTAVVTTLIFWALELTFWQMWHDVTAKYIGAALGLAIGYALKFHMDKHFTFEQDRAV
jgi:putative flippase GtrA